MTDQVASENEGEHCPLCSGDVPADFSEMIIAATATIGAKMTPAAFRAWLDDDAHSPFDGGAPAVMSGKSPREMTRRLDMNRSVEPRAYYRWKDRAGF